MTPPAPPSVTQADRDLLSSFYLMIDWIETAEQASVGDCLTADEKRMLDDIARHRTTAEAASTARVAELAGAIRALSQLAIDGGLTHDIMAQIYPGKKTANGQPADEFARRARRVVNEARALLAKHQQGEG